MKKHILVLITLISVMSYGQIPITEVEIFTTTSQAVGNITFTHTGDLVYSHHPFFSPDNRVVIMDAETKNTKPFPNKYWNTPRDTDDNYLSNVLGIRNDENGIIWMLDMAQRNKVTPKIVGWNTKTNQLERIYYLPKSSVPKESQPNDMVIDTKHDYFIFVILYYNLYYVK
ncbi:hypothetical protein FHR24_002879 [Wenyingzhuangia heitensis]|uniref:Major royal jelly protein n=1 Tax=Wenyingzhuangia heitensis TaxID=1487859 RepID=A0ABX0UC37_9FLAO|nr:L-dopachrome tautomerase-related protein [Wenyingzhuangia heitensis]NIJ46392.1 hypothetical protein [Wenyingzhuangia heitensis]